MATTIPSAALVPVVPVFNSTKRRALAGFLAGYSRLTRQAYELDLRQYASWCQQHQPGKTHRPWQRVQPGRWPAGPDANITDREIKGAREPPSCMLASLNRSGGDAHRIGRSARRYGRFAPGLTAGSAVGGSPAEGLEFGFSGPAGMVLVDRGEGHQLDRVDVDPAPADFGDGASATFSAGAGGVR